MSEYPDRRGRVYTSQIALRVEPSLKEAFEELKTKSDTDIAEAQRIVLRKLVEELRNQPAPDPAA